MSRGVGYFSQGPAEARLFFLRAFSDPKPRGRGVQFDFGAVLHHSQYPITPSLHHSITPGHSITRVAGFEDEDDDEDEDENENDSKRGLLYFVKSVGEIRP